VPRAIYAADLCIIADRHFGGHSRQRVLRRRPTTPVALVVGEANYPDNDSVLNDATAGVVADELKRGGFAVETRIKTLG
jgi:hypothetical protein